MASSAEGEHDWLFDYLANALASPSFAAPLDAFVEGELAPPCSAPSPRMGEPSAAPTR